MRYTKITFVFLLAMSITLTGCGFQVEESKEQGAENKEQSAENKEQNEKASSAENDIYAGWKTYKNEEYGFELKYPKGWDISKESEYVEDFGKEIKNTYIKKGDYRLLLSFHKKSEEVFTGRTGVSAGDFKNKKDIENEQFDIEVKNLVYKDKIKEIFFSGGNDEYVINGYFSYLGDTYKDDFVFNEEQINVCEMILKSLSI